MRELLGRLVGFAARRHRALPPAWAWALRQVRLERSQSGVKTATAALRCALRLPTVGLPHIHSIHGGTRRTRWRVTMSSTGEVSRVSAVFRSSCSCAITRTFRAGDQFPVCPKCGARVQWLFLYSPPDAPPVPPASTER